MAFDTYTSFATSLIKAWQRGESRVRFALLASVILVVIAIFIVLLAESGFVYRDLGKTIAGIIGAIAGLIGVGVSAYQSLIDQRAREQRIETVEERLREHPEKPQLAWDLARAKLENYLDRNLSQVRSIYWLTSIVMLWSEYRRNIGDGY